MAKITIKSLSERLDKAADVCATMQKRINELESQCGCTTVRIQALEAKQPSPKLAKPAGPGLLAAIQRTAERDAAAAATR